MDIDVKMGEIAIAKAADNLTVSGIGSCLTIMLYDPELKLGALAHAMLPSSLPGRQAGKTKHPSTEFTLSKAEGLSVGKTHLPAEASGKVKDTRYVDTAIDEILERMLSQGAKRENLEAKLVGGANMFAAFKSDIGKENVVSAEERLKKEGIKIVGESTGGSIGRSVEFSVASGIVTVKIKF